MDSNGLVDDLICGGDEIAEGVTREKDFTPESPMQQSPDQSNCNDNYRSPEAAAECHLMGQEMDTTDVMPESPESRMEEDFAEPEASEASPLTGNAEDQAGHIHRDELKTNVDEGDIDSSGGCMKADEVNSDVDNAGVDSSDFKADFKDSESLDDKTDSDMRHMDSSEFQTACDDDIQQSVGQNKSVGNGGIQVYDSLASETESNQADTSTDMKRISSFVDVESDSNKEEEEDVTFKQPEFTSSEVTSTSCEENVPSSHSANETDSMDAKTSGEIREIEEAVDELDAHNSKKKFSDIKGMDREKVLKDVKSHLNASSADLDNYSTVSIKGSTSSESDSGSDTELDNLDLTEPVGKDTNEVSQSTEESVGTETEVDETSLNVSGSGKDDGKSETEVDVTQTEKTDIKKVGLDKSTEDSQDDDKNSEASLEEVSEDEDDMDDDRVEDAQEQHKEENQLSGMEEVSSDEEDEEEQTEKSFDKKAKFDDKAESGVEEVSDEEEELGNDKDSEDGVENISSEEEEGEEEVVKEKKEVLLDRQKDIKAEKTYEKVKVKQETETVEVDDTGKDDNTIVKEIIENLLQIIGVDEIAEKKDVESKKRKPRDRKERHDSIKDRRESVKDRRESVKERRENVKMRSKDTQDINERLKAQASYGEDVELDYDDNVHDETKEKHGSDSEGELSMTSSEGELSEEEECEEGEIMEPGQRPYVKPKCRFFMRGHCTWGINCRFLHPGVNDKGNYQLIERPGFSNKPPPSFEEKWEEEEVERTPTPEPPPAPPEPKEETAWERGLRQAKELRKKAMERRQLETNFEHKKMNLSIEDNPEYDKENNVEKSPVKSPVKKPYYDKYEPLSDDEYYDQTPMRIQQRQMEQSWMLGGYENFQVYWTQDQYGPHNREPFPPHQMERYPYPQDRHLRDRERFPLRPSPRRLSASPPDHRQRYMRPPARDPREMVPHEKMREARGSPPSPTKRTPVSNRVKADDYIDPWTRSNAAKGKSPKKRSRSRGRRRSRRSYSYSSSYSSSSYSDSSRSRSRSSSFSSMSSHSSRSTSYSRSRSPPPRSGPRMRNVRRPAPARNEPVRRASAQARPGEPARNAAPVQGRGADRRPGGAPTSPTKGSKGSAPLPSKQPSVKAGNQQIADVGRGRKPPQKMAHPPAQPQKPLPPSALAKDRAKPKPGQQRRSGSSSTSRSRSRSRSSSSSSRSSYSSRSSRSYSRSRSRSSSSSSSGSADSEHLYRNIGARDNQKVPTRGKQDMSRPGRSPGVGRVPQERPSMKPTIGETSRPSSVAQAKIVKDPLKMTGQKSNIKLTLIKQNDKPGGVAEPVSRKRPAEPPMESPPAKRPSAPNLPKPDKPLKKVEKPLPVSPTKTAGRPAAPVKPAAGAPAAATATMKKKSTVSRREELLKQLKAVEDAIAKKKKKMG